MNDAMTQGPVAWSRSPLSVNGGKDKEELFSLLPKGDGFISHSWDCLYQHAEPELSLFGLLFAGADFVHELLSRDCVIGFAVVSSYARTRTHHLRNERPSNRIFRD